jgi:2'-phosphotransferase
MRKNCDLFVYLDVPQLLAGPSPSSSPFFARIHLPRLADSVPIFTSTNNVVLTAGVDGVIPPKYFSKVVRKDGEVLVPAASA